MVKNRKCWWYLCNIEEQQMGKTEEGALSRLIDHSIGTRRRFTPKKCQKRTQEDCWYPCNGEEQEMGEDTRTVRFHA
jgi:hypothetical protein